MSLFDSTSDRLCHSLRALAWLLRYPTTTARGRIAAGAALRAEGALAPAASTSSTR